MGLVADIIASLTALNSAIQGIITGVPSVITSIGNLNTFLNS